MRLSKPQFLLGLAFLFAGPLLQWALAQPQNLHPRFSIPPGNDLFSGTNINDYHLEIAPTAMNSLRQQPREWAKAVLRTENGVFAEVAVHIKGSQGSLQSIDERPSLTISFNKFVPGRKYHGLGKIHFNNEKEDPSCMTEILCSELSRRAGVPAARSCYATLTLNQRPLGVYVLKEGLTKEFLGQYFLKTGGNFYDGGFRKDINEPLELIGGNGPDDQSDRKALLAAARETDPERRWRRLNEVLDVDRFISLLALSAITWNWDGYPMSRNNYRIYHDPETDKMVFIPHGLDQMFWEPQGTIYPTQRGIVAAAVMSIPEARQRYHERLVEFQTNVFQVAPLQRRVDELSAKLRPYRSDIGQQASRLKQRIAARWESINQQLRVGNEVQVEFTGDSAPLRGWSKLPGGANATLQEMRTTNNIIVLQMVHPEQASSCWVLRTSLPRGTYEFSGRGQIKRLTRPPRGGQSPIGLRISAAQELANVRPPSNRVGEWEQVHSSFVVHARQEVIELKCDFWGAAGEVWYDLDSLRLRRIHGVTSAN